MTRPHAPKGRPRSSYRRTTKNVKTFLRAEADAGAPQDSVPQGQTGVINSMVKYTPGPWTFEKATVIDGEPLAYPLHTIWTDRSLLIARTCFAPASEANARLITAAPDLLEAAKKTIEENLHLSDGDNCTLIHLVRAIAKAEGRDV